MAHRQVETSSVHSSSYHTGWVRISPDSHWELVAHNKENNGTAPAEEGENVLPCTYLDLATQIHMQRSTERSKKYPRSPAMRWKQDVNFHDNLRLPSSEKSILVLFEAMASEGIVVALSSQSGYLKGSTVEITFGAVGNTKTTIFKRNNNPKQPAVSQVSIPCRVCQEGTWNSFWVGMWKGKTYAGIGNAPGQKCLAVLDDPGESDNNNHDGDQDAAIEDTSLKVAGDDTVDNIEIKSSAPAELRYVGLGNAAQQGRAVKIRNLQVTHVPSFVAQLLETTNESSTMDVLMDQQDDIDDDALKEYQEQCRKAKARAEKFGIEYKEPDLAAVVPWSQARKLRANPQKGFITGIDVTDPEELAKQEARKSRFGITDKKRVLETGDSEEGKETGEATVLGIDTSTKMEVNEDSIPISQAWDNEELVRFQRVDPPPSLWSTPPAGEGESDGLGDDEFAMETDKPTLTPEKIHIFSIDWAAFKQIRSEDLMAHFTIYGPSYVEWLGDLGCNVQFSDKFSAVRAMQSMALDLPSPPPSGLNNDDEYVPPDLGAMGWKLGRKLVHKVKNDRFGKRGTTARILMRPATSQDILVERPSSWPEPPPGFSTKRILGPGSDFNMVNEDEEDYQQTNRRKKRRRRNSDQDNNSGPGGSTSNNVGRTKRSKNGAATGKRRQRGEDSAPSQLSAADRLNQGLSSGR